MPVPQMSKPLNDRKNVFVINDIDLVVPPTSIQIGKEDLVYQWKTLRTKSTTKIPTGHGQIVVHVSIPFTNSMLLDLHRLIVEFRHSPFCYVDNRYIRESIVPDWPYHQNMAFTMTSLQVSNMPGSPDTWICEIDLRWFNYFPYTYNYLFKDDWVTHLLRNDAKRKVKQGFRYTIGWDINEQTHVRSPRVNPVESVDKEADATFRPSWDLILNQYASNERKTIFEMERVHAGEEFDLLPLPGNMEPARFVYKPEQSRIYTRYINFLQRDAMVKHFGINPERELGNLAPYFFKAVESDRVVRTYGLHSKDLPREIRDRVTQLQRSWVSRMLKHNGGIRFTYNIYKDIRLPNKFTDKVREQQQTIISEVLSDLRINKAEDLALTSKRLSKKQQRNVNIIVDEFLKAGLHPAIAVAAVVNAYAESQLDHLAVVGAIDENGNPVKPWQRPMPTPTEVLERKAKLKGVKPDARGLYHDKSLHIATGLFQLLPRGPAPYGRPIGPKGAGYGMTDAQLRDPRQNTRRIIEEVKRDAGARLRRAAAAGATVARLVEIFMRDIERPGPEARSDERIALGEQLFPELMNKSAHAIGFNPLTESISGDIAEEQKAAKQVISARLSEAKEEGLISEEEANALQQIIVVLHADGWRYYEDDPKITNVWYKTISLTYRRSNPENSTGPIYDPVTLTAVGGGLKHVVVDLPILSQEYPTQQHLGSIEPHYLIEFAAIDDESLSSGVGPLEGIPPKAQLLQGMRSALQRNARDFRGIVDAWCVSTDTFLTRLLGSYHNFDFAILLGDQLTTTPEAQASPGEPKVIPGEVRLRKRTVISRANERTEEGAPGTSYIFFELDETNPYETEEIVSYAPESGQVDEARSKVLHALYNLDLLDKYKRIILPLFIFLLADPSGRRLDDEGFGKFSLQVYQGSTIGPRPSGVNINRDVFIRQGSIMVRDPDGTITKVLDTLGALPASAKRREDTSYLQIPLDDAGIGSPLSRKDINKGMPIEVSVDLRKPPTVSPTEIIQFDISGLFESADPALFETPLFKIIHYYRILNDTIRTAETILAENKEEVGEIKSIPNTDIVFSDPGTSAHSVSEELYGLPIVPKMWRKWAKYLELTAQQPQMAPHPTPVSLGGPGAPNPVTTFLSATPGWLIDKDTGLTAEDIAEIKRISEANYGIASTPTAVAGYISEAPIALAVGEAGAFLSGNIELSDIYDHMHLRANNLLVNRYVRNLPLALRISEGIQDQFSRIVGAIGIDVTTGESGIPAVRSFQSSLRNNVLSSGFFTFHLITGNPIPPTPKIAELARDIHYGLKTVPLDANGNPIVEAGLPRLTWAGPGSLLAFLGVEESTAQQLVEKFSVIPLTDLDRSFFEWLFSAQRYGNPIGSPWKWETTPEKEAAKIRYIKQILARLADDMLRDVEVLLPFGLQNLALLDRRVAAKGRECYPDLDLPYHPFYRDTYSVHPDFYYWNIYDDGGALNADIISDVQEQLRSVVNNCYESLQKMQAGQEIVPSSDALLQEPLSDDRIAITQKLNAEGTDGKGVSGVELQNPDGSLKGAMASPFYMTEEDTVAEEAFAAGLIAKSKQQEDIAKKQVNSSAQESGSVSQPDLYDKVGFEISKYLTIENLERTIANVGGLGTRAAITGAKLASTVANEAHRRRNIEDILSRFPPDKTVYLSNFENRPGAGGGLQYPRRAATSTYEQLRETVEGLEQMFGSRAGFLNEQISPETAPEIHARIKDTNFEIPVTAHKFDPSFLYKLAIDSSKDIVSQKMSLKRAFPTFKLFFIEEDEFESRELNFDDFYSYNAVRSFTVVMTRKDPADHAVITLQNVAGVLDGTKRDVITDLDYFSRETREKVSENDPNVSVLSNDPVTMDTAADQPFGAVVLRPGLNVQLRAGFSNDPDNLEVLVSGRVIDVSWNKTGDLAEIMVQSFGTELVQVIKGTARSSQGSEVYATTHQLLGSMIMEPEVVHFGRWEFGQLFQRGIFGSGEAKDVTLDFTDYSKEEFMGRFRLTGWLTEFVATNPYLVTLGLLATTAIQFIPVTRLTGILGGTIRFFGKGVKPLARLAGIRNFPRGGTAIWRNVVTKAVGEFDDAVRISSKLDDAARAGLLANLREAFVGSLSELGSLQARQVGRLRARSLKVIGDLAGKSDLTYGELIRAMTDLQFEANVAALKGAWLAKPWVSTANPAQVLSAVGLRPIKTIADAFLFKLPRLAAVGGLTTLLLDAIPLNILRAIGKHTIKRIRSFFATKQAHLFLSPQDDNLFPPHPKDYMILDRAFTKQLGEALLMVVGKSVFGLENETIKTVDRYLFQGGMRAILADKRVFPEACRYTPVQTTIWNIFHEMSLRHPGWIYGIRPYGNRFRYTIFFGLPSQRYWAKPASNMFIHRVNKLARYLSNPTGDDISLTELEYRALYGDTWENPNTDIVTLKQLKEKIKEDIIREKKERLGESMPPGLGDTPFIDTTIESPAFDEARLGESYSDPEPYVDIVSIEEAVETAYKQALTVRALKEYIRALELRFRPFRRYHMITSDRDIIWNGLISTEQATVNAVDVTYFDPDTNLPAGTALFKAHSFIPEDKLRIAPVRWPNCKTYYMAMRYGMGELLHRLREMYRGEIILTGNARIRPWDIAIMIDSYNDMVGPIEVEQVVHNFSHETGFITEIKPSAVVFGNEISSWPVLEAMKMFAFAVRDVENNYAGVRATDSTIFDGGVLSTALDMVARWGSPEFNNFMQEKYKKIFGGEGASIRDVFGEGSIPNSPIMQGIIEDLEVWSKYGIIMGGGIAAALSAVPLFFAGGKLAEVSGVVSKAVSIGETFGLKWLPALSKGGVAATVSALGTAPIIGSSILMAQTLDFPSYAWLLGGPILFLQCLREDSIVLVPLIKNGYPIVSGLNLADPTMMFNHFRGNLTRLVDDLASGTADMVSLYKRYGSNIWRLLSDPNLGEMTGEMRDPAYHPSNTPFSGAPATLNRVDLGG